MLFLVYTVIVFLRHKNKTESLGLKFHRLLNELAHNHIFFFIGAILAHVLTPKEWPVLLIYVYIISVMVDMGGDLREKPMVRKVCFFS